MFLFLWIKKKAILLLKLQFTLFIYCQRINLIHFFSPISELLPLVLLPWIENTMFVKWKVEQI